MRQIAERRGGDLKTDWTEPPPCTTNYGISMPGLLEWVISRECRSCKLCQLTLTMLPDWLIPGGHYSLLARQQAAQLASEQDRSLEDCIPDCADSDRSADPSTVRRWLLHRTESLWLSILKKWMRPPTLFAWDWKAACRTRIPETNSA